MRMVLLSALTLALLVQAAYGTQCDSPTIENGDVDPTTSIDDQATFTVSCVTGYTLSGSATVICDSGSADFSSTTCTPTCTTADTLTDGTLTYDGSVEAAETYTASCNTGYTLGGDETAVCSSNTADFTSDPTCTPNCTPSIATLSGGTITYDGSAGTYTASCNDGYTDALSNGDVTEQCDVNIATFVTPPDCKQDCGTNAWFEGGSIAPLGGIVHDETVTITCLSGYSLVGSSTGTCNNGVLEYTTDPECLMDCTAPVIANGVLSNDVGSAVSSIIDGDSFTVTCDTGYTIAGDATGECGNGTLLTDLSTTVCNINTCNKPTISHATITPDTGTVNYQETYTVACDAGHDSSDVSLNTLTCESTGTLSTAPDCHPTQCAFPDDTGGSVLPVDANIDYGDSYTVTCSNPDPGYKSTNILTCGENGVLADSEGNLQTNACKEETCDKPTIAGGSVDPDTAINYLSSYTASCDTGYDLAGATDLVCSLNTAQDDVELVPAAPTCTIRTCDQPSNIANSADVMTPDTATIDYGASYTITCDNGYETATMTCGADEVLLNAATGLATVCEKQTCDNPNIVSGSTTPADATIEFEASYTTSCDVGYESSDQSDLVCSLNTAQDDVELAPAAPTCTIKTCNKPTITSGTVSPVEATVDFGSSYTLTTCTAGLTPSGDVMNCQSDGQLDVQHTCEATICNKPVIDHGTVSPDTATVAYSETYELVSCDEGYTASGVGDTRACQDGGTLENIEDSTCTIKTCAAPTVTSGTLSPAAATVDFGSSYTVSCDPGYSVDVGPTMLCLADSSFDIVISCLADAVFDYTCIAGAPAAADAADANSNTVACSTTAAGGTAVAEAAAQCYSPNSDTVNNAFTGHGCGSCTEDADACVECDAGSSSDNCNAYLPIVSYKCTNGLGTVDCTGTSIICFGALKTYSLDDFVLINGGCGTCAYAGYADTDCEECNTAECNGAVARVASLLPLLAAILWLCC